MNWFTPSRELAVNTGAISSDTSNSINQGNTLPRRIKTSFLLVALVSLVLSSFRAFAPVSSCNFFRERNENNEASPFHTTTTTTMNPHPEFCPYAECKNSPHCAPCRRRWLIILSTFRAASTTLTWQFDHLPGLHMGGENNDALGSLYTMFDRVMNNSEYQKKVNKVRGMSAWGHDPMHPQSQACVAQSMMEIINPDDDEDDNIDLGSHIWGFKTIRLFSTRDLTNETSVEDMASFMRTNFPCARFLVNHNANVTHQAESWIEIFQKHGADRKVEDSVEEIQATNVKLKSLAEALGPQRAVFLNSAEWTHNISKLNDVVHWLGFSKECYFQELLELNTQRYNHTKTNISMNPNCTAI